MEQVITAVDQNISDWAGFTHVKKTTGRQILTDQGNYNIINLRYKPLVQNSFVEPLASYV